MPRMTQMLRVYSVPIMIRIGRKGRIMLTSVIRWIVASTHLLYHTPIAAMIIVVRLVPRAASRPKDSAMGVPQSSATVRSRRVIGAGQAGHLPVQTSLASTVSSPPMDLYHKLMLPET